MSNTNAKLAELVQVADPAVWVSMAGFKAVTGIVRALHASSPLNAVTIQLRKATSAAGANAADLGTIKSGNYAAMVTALAADLGYTSGDPLAGTAFTFVSAVITDSKSPNAYSAVMLFEKNNSFPAEDAQYVNH